MFPEGVREMLSEYRDLQDEHGWDWGLEWRTKPLITHMVVPWRLPVVLAPFLAGRPELVEVSAGTLTESEALRACLNGVTPPPGTSFVIVHPNGHVDGHVGEPSWVIDDTPSVHWLVVDSRRDDPIAVEAGQHRVTIEPRGLMVLPVRLDAGQSSLALQINEDPVSLGDVAAARPAASLALQADMPARWSVVDDRGGAWFPAGCPQKWDGRFQPFFHGREVDLRVPAATFAVTVSRGIEFESSQRRFTPQPGRTEQVSLSPRRRIAPNESGWYSADLHVHAHYSGDLVVTPADLACMQVGEGLNVMSVLAANLSTTRIYDQATFDATVGEDLPWTTEKTVARYGIEYGNDLLGHFHSLAPSGPPERYQTGHVESEGQEDWPANAVAAAEQRALGATVGYAHPVWLPFSADGAPDSVFEPSIRGERSVEARELVVDAALGLVDTLDLLHYANWEASAQLYYHLLSCGIRLAVSVGTDVFLSISHGLNSDPPGWARMYANLGTESLSIDAYKNAIRCGRTLGTNGPWLTLEVDGHGPGDVLDVQAGDEIEFVATCQGPGIRSLEVVGPDGVIASSEATNDEANVRGTLTIAAPTWIAARATGVEHPSILRGPAYAHSSPVYLDIEGRRVGREADARWCLDWLDRLSTLVDRHGRYNVPGHREEVLATIETARDYYRASWRPTPG